MSWPDERRSHFYGVRLPMIAPVVARPGQVLVYDFGGKEPSSLSTIVWDAHSRSQTIAKAAWFSVDDLALLERDRVIVRLSTKEHFRLYGFNVDLFEQRDALVVSRALSRARVARMPEQHAFGDGTSARSTRSPRRRKTAASVQDASPRAAAAGDL